MKKKEARANAHVTSFMDICSLELAIEHHKSGRFRDAEVIYANILKSQPDNPDALHMLGVLAHQQGNNTLAAKLIEKAINIKANSGMHGNLGVVLQAQGKLELALRSFETALRLNPKDVTARFNLGNTYKDLGKYQAALTCYQQGLSEKPDFADGYNGLGVTQKALGNIAAAEASFRRAIALLPNHAEAHSNLGATLKEQGKLSAALESCLTASSLKSDFFQNFNNIGNVYFAQGDFQSAHSAYSKAASINPKNASSWNNLANVQRVQGQLTIAIENYQSAIKNNPLLAEAHNNLGAALKEAGRVVEATTSYRHAIELQPDFYQAHSNLGVALLEQCQIEAALDSFRQALAINPRHSIAHSNLLFGMAYLESNPSTFHEACKFGAWQTLSAKPYSSWPHAERQCIPLRVGIVSSDLRHHPVGFFLQGVISHFNPSKIELIAYSTQTRPDEFTQRLKTGFSAWNDISHLSDEVAAQKIHADGIHILIDLNGHTAENRLPLFAWRSAPIQVSWLGYFATTGVPGIDYLLCDRASMPELHHEQYTETIHFLPETRLCFTPPDDLRSLVVSPLPASQANNITFGCFQNLAKLNDSVLLVWGKILTTLPNSKLRLQSRQMGEQQLREALLSRMIRAGIDVSRVTLCGPQSRELYLMAYAEVDILLDTFPYPGGTTTCEALWMGVPTVTLSGESMLARQGASILKCAGLSDWVAESVDDYVKIAHSHATDLSKLALLRSNLREQVFASPLFDSIRFTRGLETVLRDIWQQRSTSRTSTNIKENADDAEQLDVKDLSISTMPRKEESDEHAIHKSALTIYQSGVSHKNKGNFEIAETKFREAIELHPFLDKAYFELATLLHIQGRLIDAIHLYKKALNLSPNFAQAHNNLAAALATTSDIHGAVTHSQKALALQPKYADALNNLAGALHALGQLEASIINRRRALELNAKDPTLLYNLALSLKDGGKTTEAILVFEQTLAVDPTGYPGLDACAKLAVLYYLIANRSALNTVLDYAAKRPFDRNSRSQVSRIYLQFVNQLRSWWSEAEHKAVLKNEQIKNTLFVIGESHALSPHNMEVVLASKILRCQSLWIEGCMQWHLGNNEENQYKAQFKRILAKLPANSTILLAIGEIDCRLSGGIFQTSKKHTNQSIEQIIDETVSAYLNYVSLLATASDLKIIIQGVPATTAINSKSEEEVVALTGLLRSFNHSLKTQAYINGFDFLDVFALTDVGNGHASGQWHLDPIHLRPDAIVEAFKQHYLSAPAQCTMG